jgi:hypothetical protein
MKRRNPVGSGPLMEFQVTAAHSFGSKRTFSLFSTFLMRTDKNGPTCGLGTPAESGQRPGPNFGTAARKREDE